MATLATAAVLQSALQPVWTYEALPQRGTESIAYVCFTSEKTVMFVTDFGLVGWLHASSGKLAGSARIGQAVYSGTAHGDRLWLRGPTNALIEINATTGSIYQIHSIKDNMDLQVSDGSPYALRSRYDKPIEVLKLASMQVVLTIPKELPSGRWTGAGAHNLEQFAAVIGRNLSIWNLATGKQIRAQRLPLGDVMDIQYTPDDKQLAITYAEWAGTILYDAKTLKRVAGIRGTFFRPVFAHSLNLVANEGASMSNRRRPARLWIPGTDRVWDLSPEEAPRAVAFSPSDRQLALGRKGTISKYHVPPGVARR